MARKKARTVAGRTIIEVIESGEVNGDLQVIRNALAKQFRETRENTNLLVYKVGEQAFVTETEPLRWLPNYVRGALVEITVVQYRWNREARTPEARKLTGVPTGTYQAKILELKRKPRGAFGNGPRYDVGGVLWVSTAEIVPVNNDEFRERFAQIKAQYQATKEGTE